MKNSTLILSTNEYFQVVNQIKVDKAHWIAPVYFNLDKRKILYTVVAHALYRFHFPAIDITNMARINTCNAVSKRCVNPSHVKFITPAERARLMREKGKEKLAATLAQKRDAKLVRQIEIICDKKQHDNEKITLETLAIESHMDSSNDYCRILLAIKNIPEQYQVEFLQWYRKYLYARIAESSIMMNNDRLNQVAWALLYMKDNFKDDGSLLR